MTSKRAEAKYQEILKYATDLFMRNGYHATSVAELAESLGMQKGGLYYHIRSKEEILFEILETTLTSLVEPLEAICASDLSARDKLASAIRSHIVTAAERLEGVIVTQQERRSLNGEFRDRYIALRDRYEHLFRSILDEGVAREEFAPLDSHMASHYILGACNWVAQWYRPTGPMSADDISRFFVTFTEKVLL